MEIFWYIIAAAGAGIGTGLAGLSAATVMVPILITLCPSFLGETGAYQATAIALASDILSSAVTTFIYARHKNIDLKRGWIMLVCILSMCTVGSYVAWLAGNVVLGSFTLFLTFFIGIRFLVKPDTSKKEALERGAKLDLKGIIISLFFGLTIGFGTGFVGTGGGMMMLIVFTAFLGMGLKTAVGTSTFIMTFTALIAAASHVMIHPAIVLERWDVMVICIVTATVFSLISARFANKVNNRAVGLVTGVVLTILGAAMLILKYWDFLSKSPLVADILSNLARFGIFIGCCVVILIPLKFLTKIPGFVFRKLLHIVAFTCVIIMVIFSGSWYAASITSLIIAAVIFPILAILEKKKWYDSLFVQKSKGEIKMSLVMLFVMFAVLTAIGWGWLGSSVLATTSIIMWGVGDACAALIGIPFGKHKVGWKITDGKKSYEGTLAMFVFAFISSFLLMFLYYNIPVGRALLYAAPGALVGAFVELISPSKWDTVTVPLAVLLVLSLLTVCF